LFPETTWVDGCVDPIKGDSFFLLLPSLISALMQLFLDTFAAAHKDTVTILLRDNSSTQKAKTLRISANVALVFQPPFCPELNPAERVWDDMRSKRAWHQTTSLDNLEELLVNQVNAYTSTALQSLTGYPSLVDAYYATCQ
jgi:transposase